MIILLSVILLLLCVIFFMHKNHIKTLDRIDLMLTAAAENRFSESEFTEKRISKTETKMFNYLSAGETSLNRINSEKDKIKSLISDISHQTKTPIANIMLYSDLLCENEKADEKTKMLSQNIKAQSEKLDFLIGSLLKLSRLENNIVALSPKENSVNDLLLRLDFKNAAKQKDIDLKIGNCADLTAVFDFKWTLEAISNIVDNALKYTPGGGTVRVSAAAYEMFVKIDIADSGIGISEEEQPKIFARFYRSQKVSGYSGVGIGLYLSREIISRQGGYIRLTSLEGEGSIFSVFLPRA